MDQKTKVEKAKLALLAMQRHSWEHGVAMDGFLAQEDDDAVIALAKEAAYRRIPDGRVAQMGGDGTSTDPCSNGAGLLYAYKKTGDEDLKEGYDGLLNWALHLAPRNEEGIVYHFSNSKLIWVDSLYMLPPFLAEAGYYEEAIKQIDGYIKVLFDEEKKLFWHQWNDSTQCFDRKLYWGVGNGWAMAGIGQVINMLPEEFAAEKARLIHFVNEHLKGVSKYIREDGFTHDILDNPETFLDTYFPQMISYTIYIGIRNGWISKEWEPLADKCRENANKKVDRYGLVQDSCGAPHFSGPGVSPESQAFYLMMEAEAERLRRQRGV